MEKDKILNGEVAVLEVKTGNTTNVAILDKQDFRDFIGHQENIEVMSDCITLLCGNQLKYDGELYRLISGKKLVIDIFKMYSNFFIESVNDSIRDNNY